MPRLLTQSGKMRSPWQTFNERVEYILGKYTGNELMGLIADKKELGKLHWQDIAIIMQLAYVIAPVLQDTNTLLASQFGALERERLYDRMMGKAIQATVSAQVTKHDHTFNIQALPAAQRDSLRVALAALLAPSKQSEHEIIDGEYVDVIE